MAINSITGKTDNIAPSATPAKKDTLKAGNAKIETGAMDDKFDVTELSKGLKQALESSPSTPVIDSKKVEAVKEALLQGKYEINPDSIAEKLLQFDRPFDST